MPSDQVSVSELILSDRLALERTLLANERTLLAYLRTALAIVVVGVTGLQLLAEDWRYQVMGAVFVGAGALVGVVGFGRFYTVRRRILARAEGKAGARPGA